MDKKIDIIVTQFFYFNRSIESICSQRIHNEIRQCHYQLATNECCYQVCFYCSIFHLRLFGYKPQLVRVICCRRRSNRWSGDVLCAHVGRSLFLLLFFNHYHPTFSSLLVYSRSSSIHAYTSRRQRRSTSGFSSLILFICQEKNEGGENERKKQRTGTLMNNILLFLDWSEAPVILSSDRHTQHPIQFHQYQIRRSIKIVYKQMFSYTYCLYCHT